MKAHRTLLASCIAVMAVVVFSSPAWAQPPETIEAYELHQAVRKKDAAKVKALIDGGTNINGIYNGSTPLHAACGHWGSVEMARLLLSKGADVNAREDGNGPTPLLIAMRGRQRAKELVPLLIKHGADVNARGGGGRTALYAAVNNYSPNNKYFLDIIKLLISKGADVNAANPLFYAVASGHPETVKLLLENGADPNQSSKGGKAPLKYAQPLAKSTTGTPDGIRRYQEITKLLLARGATMEGKPYKQQPASQQTKPKPAGKTTAELAYDLNSAVVAGDLVKVKKMLDGGLSVNVKDRAGNTPIFMACWMGKKTDDIVKFLLSKGADPDIKNVKKQTALFPAAKNKKLFKVLIPLLIKHGADVKVVAHDGSNAVLAVITNLGRPNVETKDVLDMTRLLLSKGAGVDPTFEGGRTPLMFVAMEGHLEVVKLLVKYGANVKAKSNRGETPLKLAEQGGHRDVVRFLKSKM